ncbi:protein tyrosine phosphatase domain-containing protein 1-like isoform X1 [Haliotis rubra]|uniref:protein tyrosine phosphatase domain-containing protein 1-like isoform X1 n=1 Tax=Haliotis rubra TaxID=36100 RepID=UPI001EE5C846|nr:protein tyrosine phosphatase domain-containing protein 1-like isoform X1 [Haliotis rubra]
MEPDPDEQIHPGLESLDWGNDSKGTTPSAKYNKLSEQARKLMSAEKQCAMFCGGKKCKYCTYNQWSKKQMDIDGIYSNWVTEKILAMARPTHMAIKEKKLLDAFENAGIKTVINLQMPGEHASCGEGLDKSGFSYDPQQLMEKGIFFYNFGWNDYGVASMSTLLDIAKVMQFGLSEGKIAIHCHAGLGRTGLMIACYLVFTNRELSSDAVQYVRSRRPNSIQTGEQVRTVAEFEEYLKPFRIIFASKDPDAHDFSLRQFLNRQQHILHGFEAKKLKYIPKIVYVCCERLLELASKGNSLNKTRSTLSMSDLKSDILKRTISGNSLANNSSSQISVRSNENAPSDEAGSETATSEHFEDLKQKDFKANDVNGNENGKGHKKKGANNKKDDCIADSRKVNRKSNSEGTLSGSDNSVSDNTVQARDSGSASGCGIDSGSSKSYTSTSPQGSSPEDPSLWIVEALIETDYSDIVLKKVAAFEEALNQTDEAWSVIAQDQDPVVLSLLMWEWLDQLSEPALSAQDLLTLLGSHEPPLDALFKVEKGVKYLLEYVSRVIIKLQPISSSLQQSLLERFLSHLTHQSVRQEVLSRHGPESMDDWPKMRSNTTRDLIRFVEKLIKNMKVKDSKKR